MKIAVVYQGTFPPRKGASGADRRVENIALGLAFNSHDVCMLTPKRNRLEDRSDAKGFPVHYLGPKNYRTSLIGRYKFWRDVCIFARKEKLDWVLLYSALADSIAPAVFLKRNGIFVAAEFCDLRSCVFPGRGPRETFMRWLYRADETLLPKVTDLNIVISGFLAEHVTKHAPKTSTMLLPVIANTTEFATTCQGASRFRNKWKLVDKSIVAYVGGTLESRRCQVSN